MNALANDSDYGGPERRATVKSMTEIEIAVERQFREHDAREVIHTAILIDALKAEAFPDGAIAHRAAHQAMIDAAKTEADFWKGLKLEIAKKSIWGILQILVVLTIAGVAAKFGIAPAAITWMSK